MQYHQEAHQHPGAVPQDVHQSAVPPSHSVTLSTRCNVKAGARPGAFTSNGIDCSHVQEVSSNGAKEVLVDVGLWLKRRLNDTERQTSPDLSAEAAGTASTKEKRSPLFGTDTMEEVVPWPAEVLEASSALAKERTRRRDSYAKREPLEEVGAPAPFGR